MNLDDLELFQKIDAQNFLAQIDDLPNQLAQAWDFAQTLPLPDFKGIQNIVISAMGDSAIGAELTLASASSNIRLPVTLLRGYELPAYADGKQTLVICISHSGNSEEVLNVFDQAHKNGCSLLVISTGGEISKRAVEQKISLWKFSYAGTDTMGVAYPFALTLALFARLGWIPNPAEDVAEALDVMKRAQAQIVAAVPSASNPAKRYAGQLVGRWVTLTATEQLAPVARRWKTQINQLAKAGANFEIIPEATHNALIATVNPNSLLNAQTLNLFLCAKSDHPRNRLRSDLMRQALMLEGLNTDQLEARGETRIAQFWSLLLFGDYLAYYLAMAYGANPAEEELFINLKDALR